MEVYMNGNQRQHVDGTDSGCPPTKPEDATQHAMSEARIFLNQRSEGHAQKVLIAAIGNFPDKYPDLLDQKEKPPPPLLKLEVPTVLAPIGEGQASRTQFSFIEESESYAQKALIYSVASKDPDFYEMLKHPILRQEGSSHDVKTSDLSSSLGTPISDADESSTVKWLVDNSEGIQAKALIHCIAAFPEGAPDSAEVCSTPGIV